MVICKTLLYRYRQLHCSCKNRWYLQRYCRRCWNKIWDFNFEIDRPFLIGENKNVIALMNDELGEQIMKEFVEIRAKTYSYLIDKKAKGTKKCIINRKLKFEDDKNRWNRNSSSNRK